jgi:hypothetical protein
MITRQSSDRGVVHAHRLRDCPTAGAGGQALERFALLVIGELGFRTEPHALGDGNLPAGVRRYRSA